MTQNIVVLLKSEDGRKIVQKHCRAVGLHVSELEQLIEAEIEQLGKKRKAGLWEEFDRIFDEIDVDGEE